MTLRPVAVLVLWATLAPWSPAQVITTFAGSDFLFTGDGQPGTAVTLAQPTFLTLDASGNVLIMDTELNTLMKLSPSGIVSVVAGAGLNAQSGDGGPARSATLGGAPSGVAVDSAGNIYLAEQYASRVRKITPAGIITTIAGTGIAGFSGDGGPAVQAMLHDPAALAVDQQGNLYVALATDARIRKINSSGTITTIAGTGMIGAGGDGGPAAKAQVSGAGGLVVDASGVIYYADQFACRVRRIDTTGIITTIAGTTCGYGGDGGPALKAQLNGPSGIAFDAQGNLFVSELLGNRVRRIDVSGNITTVAGTGAIGFAGDGASATQAVFSAPQSIAIDPSGNVWVADRDNQRVRMFSVGGNINTAVGIGASFGDGGPFSGAKFNNVFSLARDSAGNVYVADFGQSRIRKLATNGIVSTIAGTGRTGRSPDGTLATSANLYSTSSVAIDPQGNVIFTDSANNRIRRINPDGTLTTIVGTGAFGESGDGGPATSAVIAYPQNLTYDSKGNLYFTNVANAGTQVRAVSPDGTITLVAGNGQIAYSGDNGSAKNAGIGQCTGLTVDSGGNVYIVDLGNQRIRKVAPSGIITTVAGTGTMGFSQDGTVAVNAAINLDGSGSATIDPLGRLVFPESNRVRAITGGGTLVTLAGNSVYNFSGDGGAPQAATFSSVAGMFYDPFGNLFISDAGNTRIREVFATAAPLIQLSQTGFTFATATGVTPPAQTLTILNAGLGTLAFNLSVSSGASWLSLSANSGTASSKAAGVPVVLSVDPESLAPGDYYATITVAAPGVPNSPQTITVVLHLVAASALPTDVTINPGGLIFTASQGGAAPAPQTLMLSTAVAQTFTYSASVKFSGTSFFTLANPTGTLTAGKPVVFTIAPSVSGLSVGVYSATLTLTASPAPAKQVSVILVIGPPGTPTSSLRPAATASCTPSKLLPVLDSLSGGFTAIVAWPIPLEARVVDDCGNAISTGSVVASFSSSDPPLTLNSLQNGSWAATWQTASNANQVTITITAKTGTPAITGTVQVAGGLSANQNAPPFVAQGGVLNAASYQLNSPVSPGSLVSIFGANLATSLGQAAALPLPDDLNTTEVVLAGKSLPLVFVSSAQINAMIPFDVPVNTTQQIVVTRAGAVSLPQPVSIVPANAGVFAQNGQGTGIGIVVIVNSDGSETEISPANPASAGSVLVVYATGLGDVNPRLLAGAATPVSPLSQTNLVTTATIGGVSAQVLFAGPTPGETGLYQVNMIVPAGVTPGAAVPLILKQGGVSTPPVTIPIQ